MLLEEVILSLSISTKQNSVSIPLVSSWLIYLRIWAATWQNQQNECAPSKDSDQPGHPPSLIRVFIVRMKKTWVLSYPVSTKRRLWSDWAGAQADLSLRRSHMSFYWFCHEAARIWFTSQIIYVIWCTQFKKVNIKVQGVPQSQAAINPWYQEEEKKDRNWRVQK